MEFGGHMKIETSLLNDSIDFLIWLTLVTTNEYHTCRRYEEDAEVHAWKLVQCVLVNQ